MVNIKQAEQGLMFRLDNEILMVEAWGRSGARIRATRSHQIRRDWVSALISPGECQAEIKIQGASATLRNGALRVEVSPEGELSFINAHSGRPLLKEKPMHALSVPARQYRDLQDGLFQLQACFEACDDERIFGLGQHQHDRFDQKGCVIDLVQRNTEISIPFFLSSRGYGFLWNNPAVGRVELGDNATRWVAEVAPQIDYWVTAAETPAEILSDYADVTGHAPIFPEWAAGFWQSKLRYASQEELETTAMEYKHRGLPLSVIVIDFFNWTRQGEWQFNPDLWPDPAGMVKRLEKLGIRVMVSIWPTVNRLSANYAEMQRAGFLLRNKNGVPAHSYFVDNLAESGIYVHFYDPTNPEARKYVWDKVKQGYYRHGIKIFWLDACEPEMNPFQPENLIFHSGDGAAVANIYPLCHAQGFFESMQAEGETEIITLCRSAWAGSQRYGAAVWSGDIPSTFEALRAQVKAGLNIAISGIPWWTHDIGGFRGGDSESPAFHELLVRWFQFGAFSPIFRLHGQRLPVSGDFQGGPNEVWSFGEEAYCILKKYLLLRERLRPYILEQMHIAHESGLPLMRPLFVDFPSEKACYEMGDQYMFGPDLLVAPVVEAEARSRRVYLPGGERWTDAWTNQEYPGGQWQIVEAPLERIPLFLRGETRLPILEESQATSTQPNASGEQTATRR